MNIEIVHTQSEALAEKNIADRMEADIAHELEAEEMTDELADALRQQVN